MALIKCKECGHKVSTKAAACQNCGAPQKFKLPGCGGCLLVVLLIFIVVGIVAKIFTSNFNAAKEHLRAAEDQNASSSQVAVAVSLPPHKFNPSSRPGRSKSQIRAIVKLGSSMTESDFKKTAVNLCKKYQPIAWGSFLVQFFSDNSCLQKWDGTGLLRDSDWPYWLCRVTVETDKNGELYAHTFELAVDEKTGLKRTDVLR